MDVNCAQRRGPGSRTLRVWGTVVHGPEKKSNIGFLSYFEFADLARGSIHPDTSEVPYALVMLLPT